MKQSEKADGTTEKAVLEAQLAAEKVFRQVNRTLVAWAMRKYKHLAGRKTRACLFLESIAEKNPRHFAHWQKGTVGAFA
jgi:hypothetical protein